MFWKISKLCNCIVYNQKIYGRIQTLIVHLKVFYYVLLTIWLYELSIPLGMPGETHRTLPAWYTFTPFGYPSDRMIIFCMHPLYTYVLLYPIDLMYLHYTLYYTSIVGQLYLAKLRWTVTKTNIPTVNYLLIHNSLCISMICLLNYPDSHLYSLSQRARILLTDGIIF